MEVEPFPVFPEPQLQNSKEGHTYLASFLRTFFDNLCHKQTNHAIFNEYVMELSKKTQGISLTVSFWFVRGKKHGI
jgi:hypothetical protein